MSIYLIVWKKKTESRNPRVEEKKYGKIMLSSNCAICGSKKLRIVTEQEANGLLSSLG